MTNWLKKYELEKAANLKQSAILDEWGRKLWESGIHSIIEEVRCEIEATTNLFYKISPEQNEYNRHFKPYGDKTLCVKLFRLSGNGPLFFFSVQADGIYLYVRKDLTNDLKQPRKVNPSDFKKEDIVELFGIITEEGTNS